MAWMAFEHLRVSGFAVADNAAVIGLDRNIAAAVLCILAAVGLMVRQARSGVAAVVVLGITYMLSARQLAGTLGFDALTYAPVLAAALYVCWPHLNRAKT
jgi:hypothetical protein